MTKKLLEELLNEVDILSQDWKNENRFVYEKIARLIRILLEERKIE